MKNDSAAERASFVDEIMQREREEASRVRAEPPRRSRGRSLIVLLPILVGLNTWNVLTMTRATRSPVPPIQAEAARFLHMSPATLREKAVSGAIPAAKPGKRWVFLKSELVAFLKAGYPNSGKALQSGSDTEVSLCHSTNAAKRGGSVSRLHPVSEYDALLGLKKENAPKNSTTD